MLKIISFLLLSLAVVNAASIGDADEELRVLESAGDVSENDRADLATALALAEVAPELIEGDAAIEALINDSPVIATQRGPIRAIGRWLGIIKKVKNRQGRNLGVEELGARSLSDIHNVDEELRVLESAGDVPEGDRPYLATALALAEVAPELIEDDAAISALSNASPVIATQRGPIRAIGRMLGLIRRRRPRNLGVEELGARSISDTRYADEELRVLESAGDVSEEDRPYLATALALAEVAPELIEDDAAIEALSNASPFIATQRGPIRRPIIGRWPRIRPIKKVKDRRQRNLGVEELGAQSISDTVEQVRLGAQ